MRIPSSILLLLALAAPATVGAQRFEAAERVQEVPGLDRVGVDEHLDEELPLDTEFTDSEGRTVRLGDLFDGERPVMLTFSYHSCPTLCSMVLDATVNAAKEQDWTIGDEFVAVNISIDPRDTPAKAAEKQREILEKYGRDVGGEWHFLVGDEEASAAVARAAGFRYFYDERVQQYAHPATLMLLTPQGKMARYLYGLRFEPNDVKFGLLEAADGKSISTTEQILLYCYTYDPNEQSYVPVAMNIMKLGGVLTVLILGAFLIILWRRERRRSQAERDDHAKPHPSSPELRQADL
ncbi:MAG: hypothetical protein CMN30_11285 [Sandaracinus sp.]|nr:hypothetical protein [Sandaracinus sp.]MAR57353.1 hypothetical protein [Rickettsiales bacterium]|tara:strand:- start:4173 stop:5054 length:882 start_codon:yes stop_codon:yes gene_type:complete